MIKRTNPSPQEVYRHFKNKLYQIVTIAQHSETKEELVIYQALYGDYKIYARPLLMFMSMVDKDKYPESTQKYRFEKVEFHDEMNTEENVSQNSEYEIKEYTEADPLLLQFLDTETFEEKRNLLVHMKSKITDRLINDIAVSLDVAVDEGDLEKRYESLMNCVITMSKYEINR